MSELSEKPLGGEKEQDSFLQEFLKFCRAHDLFDSGEGVLVAVSGGLDSSVLCHVLARAQRLLNIRIELAHVDHKTRGTASRQEGVWVRVLGERLGIKTHLLELGAEAGENQKSSQNEMRSYRRGLLLETAARSGLTKICTAHHRNDNAETFLMRAIGGTGVAGLAAISPRDRVWVRPLLWAGRDQLENYSRKFRLGWVEDPSNSRSDYLRNGIRLEVLPNLERLRQGSIKNLATIAERIHEEEVEWEKWILNQLEAPFESLPRAWLEKWPEALQRRIFKVWLAKLGIEYDPALVEALVDGEEVVHSRGSFLRRSDMFIFSPEKDFGRQWLKPIPVELGKRMSLGISTAWSFLPGAPEKFIALQLSTFFLFRPPETSWLEQKHILAWDQIPWPLMIRHRGTSDAHNRLDKILAQNRIPRPFWKSWPLLVSAQDPARIIALLGLEVFEEFRLKKLGRCVSVECFFGDRLKANLPS